MNAIQMNLGARSAARERRTIFLPLDQWPFVQLCLTAAALALLVFLFGMYLWRWSGAGELDASRAALSTAQTKAQEAGRLIAELPALRARAAASGLQPEHWSASDALHAVADLAAQSGLRVSEIEPLQSKSADPKTPQPILERALKLRADGSFAEIRRFLEAINGLPRLVVPEAVQIRRQAGAPGIEATLRVFETLPAVPLAAATRANAFVVDPFGGTEATAQTGDMMLVGTFVGRHRAMALVQSGRDVDDFAPGQQIGGERLRRVAPREIELGRDDGLSRTLMLAEDRP